MTPTAPFPTPKGTPMTTATIDITTPTTTRWAAERTLKHYWDLGPAADALDGPGVVKAVLAVSHSKDRKVLVATLYQSAHHDTGTGFTVEKYEPFDSATGLLTIATEPIARYSEKALKAFAAEALDTLAFHLDVGTEAVATRFTPPTVEA